MHEEPRAVWPPEPGCFRIRLVRGGPWVAAQITHDDGVWQATIDGERMPAHEDPALADGVDTVWHYGRRIDRFEHDFMVARRQAAASDSPLRRPREPYDRMTLSPAAIPRRHRRDA